MNWQKIYHSGAIDRSDPDQMDIVSRRNAEIIVPKRLELTSLRYIYCRSVPERDTLAYLLTPTTFRLFQTRTLSSSRSDLFYRLHTYLESVRLDRESVVLQFSPDTESEGPFRLRVEFSTIKGLSLLQKTNEHFIVRNRDGNFVWRIPTPSSEYQVAIYLDDALIYANAYRDIDIPF